LAVTGTTFGSTENIASAQHSKLIRRRKQAGQRLLTLTLAASVAACAGHGGGTASVDPTIAASAAGPSAKDASLYVIGPGDDLDVFVYHSPELSLPDVTVRPDGRISVPLIEDVVASGKTAMQLSRELEDKLKKYVREPQVTVIVKSFVGPLDRQVRVIGEAADPAALAYRQHMTLLDVMIATKGLTRFAAGNRAVIVRRTPNGGSTTIPVHLDDLIKDGDVSQNVEMQPGDTLIIPQTWF
jgi:polysaccharide export outer membrane protein